MPHYHAPHSRRKLRRLNARQRKKYHLAEFQNFTFCIQGALQPEKQDDRHYDDFIDEVYDFIEKHQIYAVGGGSGSDFWLMFDHIKNPPHNITPELREKLIAWLVARDDVASLRSGDLVDGYYADEHEWDACPHIHK